MNHARISLTVVNIIEQERDFMLELRLPKKKDVVILGRLSKRDIPEGTEVEKGKVYLFSGYLKTDNYKYEDKVHQVTLQIKKFKLHEQVNEYVNEIETVCKYMGRTKIENTKGNKKVCNIFVSFLSDNLKGSGIEIAVWGSATKPIEFAEEGQKMHLTSFVSNNFNTGYLSSLKICPFKITVL